MRIEDGREEDENNVRSNMTKMIEIKISKPNGDLKHVAYHLNFYEKYVHHTQWKCDHHSNTPTTKVSEWFDDDGDGKG